MCVCVCVSMPSVYLGLSALRVRVRDVHAGMARGQVSFARSSPTSAYDSSGLTIPCILTTAHAHTHIYSIPT